MNNNFYYPISSTSLASLFGSGCIFPASLYANRLDDIQSTLSNVILLTSNFGCQECDCCLEVFLTKEEKFEFLSDLGKGFYVYERPIPISRVKKIYFNKAEQAKQTITSIRMSTAFIPEFIINYSDTNFDHTSASKVEMPKDFYVDVQQLKKYQDDFDRILGSLALMKVAHVKECNVSPHYIDALAYFNSEIKDAKIKSGQRIDEKLYAYSIFEKPHDIIKQVITEQHIENAAAGQKIIKSPTTRIIDSSILEGRAYLYSILYTYGIGAESKRKKIDDLILENFKQLKEGKEESVAFYYGYNRGYSKLGNIYKDGNNQVEVTYKMESLLDYYIIESVFNKVVFGKYSGRFDYFDWVVTTPIDKKLRKDEYIVIDTLIRDKKKVALFSEEWWNESLPLYLKKEDLSFFGDNTLLQIFKENFIEPWTQFVKKEVESQFEEDKNEFQEINRENKLIKTYLDKTKYDSIKLLEEQPNSRKNPSSTTGEIFNESNHQLNSKVNIDAHVSKEAVDNDPRSMDSKTLCLEDKKELVSTAIRYAKMKITDLKKIAKESGIDIKSKSTEDIIMILMKLETDSQGYIFNIQEIDGI